MKIREALNLTVILLKLKADLNNSYDPETRLLVRLANLIINEIAADFVPLYKTEEVIAVDGKIDYSALSETPADIKSVLEINGGRLGYKLFPTHIKVDASRVKVVYTYLPKLQDIDGEVDFPAGKLNERLLCYGIMSEYCLLSGMYDEAKIWDSRYRDGLSQACRNNSEIQIKARAWK